MLDKIKNAIIEYEMDEIVGYVEKAKASGLSASEILDGGLIKGMDVVGKYFGDGDIFVPEVLMAANTMQAGLDVIREDLVIDGDDSGKGTIVMGTIEGDLHDIGKKLVAMMFEGAGYKVVDLGVDVAVDDFVNAAKENNAQFVGMSAMLTTTMTNMEKVIQKAADQGLEVKALVGGAPLTDSYAKSIGAYYSPDAAEAVNLINSL